MRHGPVTLLSVAEDGEHGFKLLVAQGASEPGPTLAIGNTNSRYRFSSGRANSSSDWNEQAPAHHCAIGIGHLGPTLDKLARLLQIPVHQVC